MTTINPLDYLNKTSTTGAATSSSGSAKSEETKTNAANSSSNVEDELQSIDITDEDSIDSLSDLYNQTQDSQAQAVIQKFQNLAVQIQIELENVNKEKRVLLQEMASYRPQEGEESRAGDFNQRMSELNSKADKLRTQLSSTLMQFELSVKQLELDAQQNALSLQNIASANAAQNTSGTSGGSTSAAAGTSGSITSNLDGSTAQIDSLIEKYANEAGLDPNFVKAVVKAESSFNPNATSGCGAQGLMQLMPATAASLGVTNAYDPQQNIQGGVKYLKQMYEKFGSYDLALAAYNAGPGAVQKYGGVPPYNETQNYVKKINQYWNEYKGA